MTSNKNVANYTNFTDQHTNNKVLQAPGGNSSINLGWSTQKTDYGPQRYIKKASRQRQHNDTITAKPGQQMGYQQQRGDNSYQTNSQKYAYGENYKQNRSNSLQYGNNYNNNNNLFNDMYNGAQKQKDLYSAKLINQQIDSINFGLNKPKNINSYQNYNNNNNNNNSYSNNINNNNYNNYNDETPNKYNRMKNYDNNNNGKYNLITNQPISSYPSRHQTIQSANSNQSYRNVYQNSNSNNNNGKNLQQIDIAIQKYSRNNKKTPTNAQRQQQYQQQQYQPPQYQYRPSVKINGPPKQNYIIGDQDYNYWNDNAGGNKYENRVVNTEKKINHFDRNQGNNYDKNQSNQKYQRNLKKEQPRTSVKVHNPPGGRQNFVLG